MPKFKVLIRQIVETEVQVDSESADAAWEEVDPFITDGDFEIVEAEVYDVLTWDGYE